MRKSMRGRASLPWRFKNRMMQATPITSGSHTRGSSTLMFAVAVNPSSKPPIPKVESTRESQSSVAWESTASLSRTTKRVSARRMADVATRIRNMKRQPSASQRKPPMVGPMLGAKPSEMPAKPMAVPCLPSGKRVMAMVCKSGMRMPVPTASKTRPMMSMGKVMAMKSQRDPTR